MTGPPTYREATPADADALRRFAAMAGFPDERTAPAWDAGDARVEQLAGDWGRAWDVGVLALGEADEPLGAAWARVLDPCLARDDSGRALPELAIAVARELRGHGVGAQLLERLARAATRAGIPALTLFVYDANPARTLYARSGFEPIERRGEAAVMQRTLGGGDPA